MVSDRYLWLDHNSLSDSIRFLGKVPQLCTGISFDFSSLLLSLYENEILEQLWRKNIHMDNSDSFEA